MGTAQSFDKTVQELRYILEGWQQIDASLKVGSIALPDVQTQLDSFLKLNNEITSIEITLAKLRNDRKTAQSQLQESRKRILSTIRGLYGDDSNEYEMVGGKRMSERKRTRPSSSTDPSPAN